MSPQVTVVIPCYNQAEFMEETLQSVLDQEYQDWECVIVNDGSIDATEELALAWEAKDNRFRYLKKENGGLSDARNAGIAVAKGEFILPLDADDIIGKKYLALGVKAFADRPSLKVVYSKANKFGAEEGPWKLPPFSLPLLAGQNLIFCTAFFRKTDWEKVGGYDLQMKYGLEDWEFWIHLLKNGGEVYRIPEVCFYYRIRHGSMVRTMSAENKKYLYDYLSTKHTAFFLENAGNFPQLLEENYLLKHEIAKLKEQSGSLLKRLLRRR